MDCARAEESLSRDERTRKALRLLASVLISWDIIDQESIEEIRNPTIPSSEECMRGFNLNSTMETDCWPCNSIFRVVPSANLLRRFVMVFPGSCAGWNGEGR